MIFLEIMKKYLGLDLALLGVAVSTFGLALFVKAKAKKIDRLNEDFGFGGGFSAKRPYEQLRQSSFNR
jgi:hypothetical protein